MDSFPSLFLLQPNKLSPTVSPITTTPARIPGNIFLNRKCQTLEEVRQLHAQLVVSGLLARLPTAGKLIESYLSTTSHIYSASLVFNTIESPDAFAYNTMIRGLTVGNQPHNSLLLYNKMLLSWLIPDNYTYTFVLKACSCLSALFEGKQVHCQIIKAGVSPDTHVHSSLIHMYANSDGLNMAQRVLTVFPEENTLVKNSMISGYLRHGCIEKAREMFDGIRDKDGASWSAMVSGYTKNGMYVEALGVFGEMMASGVKPNESTLVSVLSACARLGTLEQGRWIHMYVDRIGADVSMILGTALVEMYAKSGSLDSSYEVFRKMPNRDVVTWGAMISGFAMHGQAEKCFELFEEMIADEIHPNAVIFVAILSACSHVGYVEAGYHYFNQIVQSFGIKPAIEHYGCMVDLLSRAGRLAEAEEIIVSMPEDPNSVIWGALLAACRTHKDLKRGKRAFRCLIELEPLSGDRYKLAGHMFAATGKQEDAIEVRKLIKEKEMETTCGSSFIEVDGNVHEFVVGDTDHSKAREIYVMLEEIKRRLDQAGFVGMWEELLLDIEGYGEEALSGHSERPDISG